MKPVLASWRSASEGTSVCHIEALAIVAANAFGRHNYRSANSAPLARLLADLTGVAFRPALDPKDGQVREQPEKCANGAKEAAVKIPDENRRCKQYAQPKPQAGGSL